MLSLSTNFFSTRMDSSCTKNATNKMNKKHCLAFVVFCAMKCNGTGVIAEIVRMVEDRTLPWFQDHSDFCPKEMLENFDDDFYKLLCYLADQMFFKDIGSCTNPRHVYTNPGSLYNFSANHEALMKDLNKINIMVGKDHDLVHALKELMSDIVKDKKKQYKGMGLVVAHDYVQLCSLLGLLPLRCYTLAVAVSVKQGTNSKLTGPQKFIGKCLNFPDKTITSLVPHAYQHVFDEIYQQYHSIWKHKSRKDWQENTLCELNRIVESSPDYKNFIRRRKNNKRDKSGRAKIASNTEHFGAKSVETSFDSPIALPQHLEACSPKKDSIYLYRSREYMRQIQPQFNITTSKTKPVLKIISHLITKKNDHKIETIELTTWSPTRKDHDQHISWNQDDTLYVSVTINSRYSILTEEVSCGIDDCCGECCNIETVIDDKDKKVKCKLPVQVCPLQRIPVADAPFISPGSVKYDFRAKPTDKLPIYLPKDIEAEYKRYVTNNFCKEKVNAISVKKLTKKYNQEWEEIHKR